MIDSTQYKEALETELTQVVADLQKLGIQNPEVAADWIATPGDKVDTEADQNIIADRVEDWEERRATLSVIETRYNNITKALQKIAEGTYGICEIGGEEIEAKRLEANPAARTCKVHIDNESDLIS